MSARDAVRKREEAKRPKPVPVPEPPKKAKKPVVVEPKPAWEEPWV
jgi:hypothetical protein